MVVCLPLVSTASEALRAPSPFPAVVLVPCKVLGTGWHLLIHVGLSHLPFTSQHLQTSEAPHTQVPHISRPRCLPSLGALTAPPQQARLPTSFSGVTINPSPPGSPAPAAVPTCVQALTCHR